MDTSGATTRLRLWNKKSTQELGDDSCKDQGRVFSGKESDKEGNSAEMVAERRISGKGVPSMKPIGTDAAVVGKKEHGVVTTINYKVDDSGVKEFGGVLGTLSAMIFFPFLMWYLWIGQFYYDAQLPWPDRGESLKHFWWKLVGYVIEVGKNANANCLSHANYSGCISNQKSMDNLLGIFCLAIRSLCDTPWGLVKGVTNAPSQQSALGLLLQWRMGAVHHPCNCCYIACYKHLPTIHNYRRVWSLVDSFNSLWNYCLVCRIFQRNFERGGAPYDGKLYLRLLHGCGT